MHEPAPGDVALAAMSAFVDALARGGVSDACVAPGSRSTPLVLALERHPGITVRVHLDERAAGFFAVGLAKSSRAPVVLACTSGTAAVNFHPAVVEAAQAGVPLIVLTADRPPELRGTGANQTIDQVGLYGTAPRLAIDAPVPDAGPHTLRTWRELAARALGAASGEPSEPGAPVHINLPFREPLAPTGATVLADAGAAGPAHPAGPSLESLCAAEAGAVAARMRMIERGVIVAGWLDGDGSAVLDLARATGWPLIAEPISNARRPGALAAPLHVLDRFDAPDMVVHLGGVPTTRAAQGLLARAASVVTVSAFERKAMPGWAIDRRVRTDERAFARAVASQIPANETSAWAKEWTEQDARARAAIDELLDGWSEPFEGRVARDLTASLPNGATLFVGSSTPVRDLDLFMAPRDGLRIFANRGASGIDGSVSSILGIAAAGASTFGLIGDLALLHDASGLLWGARMGLDAVIVVVNNRGGGIFDLLPSATLPEHERLFIAPHDIDVGALARAAGAGFTRAERAQDLAAAVGEAARARGVHIVEVPIDRARALEMRAAVRAAVSS